MLGKLLKYELKASGRILLPMFGALIIVSIAAYHTWFSAYSLVGHVAEMVMTMLYYAFFFGTCALSMIISVTRFKKNILGSEGYLMNTIPVSPMANVFAKLIVATLYQLVGGFVAILSLGICTRSVRLDDIIYAIRSIGDLSSETRVSVLVFWFSAFLGLVLFNVAVYTSLAIGHSFNGAKLIKSIEVFLLLWIVGSTVMGVVLSHLFTVNTSWQLEYVYLIIFEVAYSLIGLALTNYFLKNRLNLE